MKLTNQSKYDTKEINALVRFATKRLRKQLPSYKYKALPVLVTGTKHAYSGRAYHGYGYRILVRVGTKDHFPLKQAGYGWKYKTCPKYSMNTWQEAVVAVTAHEARHIYQFEHHKRHSEIDCERYALKTLERFRSK